MNDPTSKGASPYMVALTKETVTLQRVLSRILPPDQVKVLSPFEPKVTNIL